MAEDLDRVIRSPGLMPPGTEVEPLGHREYGLRAPGMREALRVTTDPAYYEEHAESAELWSPGNPLFQAPEFVAISEALPEEKKALIDFFSERPRSVTAERGLFRPRGAASHV